MGRKKKEQIVSLTDNDRLLLAHAQEIVSLRKSLSDANADIAELRRWHQHGSCGWLSHEWSAYEYRGRVPYRLFAEAHLFKSECSNCGKIRRKYVENK